MTATFIYFTHVLLGFCLTKAILGMVFGRDAKRYHERKDVRRIEFFYYKIVPLKVYLCRKIVEIDDPTSIAVIDSRILCAII